MNWDHYRYTIADYWKRHSLKTHFKRLLVLLSAIYLLFMYFTRHDNPGMVTETQPQAISSAPTSILKHSDIPASTQDLRPEMTTQQSLYYWHSFHHMMEYAKPLEPKEFDGKVIRIAYVADAIAQAPNGYHCRPFTEKVEMAGQWNERKGIACRKAPLNWCRQIEGEEANCRAVTANGLQGMEMDYNMTMHNLGVDWDRNMRNLADF